MNVVFRIHVAQTGKHLLRTQNVSEQNQKHFLCPQQMLHVRAKGETFVSATKGPFIREKLRRVLSWNRTFGCSYFVRVLSKT